MDTAAPTLSSQPVYLQVASPNNCITFTLYGSSRWFEARRQITSSEMAHKSSIIILQCPPEFLRGLRIKAKQPHPIHFPINSAAQKPTHPKHLRPKEPQHAMESASTDKLLSSPDPRPSSCKSFATHSVYQLIMSAAFRISKPPRPIHFPSRIPTQTSTHPRHPSEESRHAMMSAPTDKLLSFHNPQPSSCKFFASVHPT